MKTILIACLLALALVPAAEASKEVHKCYGSTTAGACIDYTAVNDACVVAYAAEKPQDVCIQFIGPPI